MKTEQELFELGREDGYNLRRSTEGYSLHSEYRRGYDKGWHARYKFDHQPELRRDRFIRGLIIAAVIAVGTALYVWGH